ncbi:MAG: PH domain-containing protein [Chitinophagaceae bacterium]|nr:PH domain-containing protein [Chitinophagaceae bacterium]
MTTLDHVKWQIKNLTANRPAVNPTLLFQYCPAFNHVHQFIVENEIISGYCIGSLTRAGKQVKAGKWLAVCTNRQFILLHKGLPGVLTHFEIPLEKITSVTPTYSWLNNKIKIPEPGFEWELYQVNKTDLKFFEEALNICLLNSRK